MIPLIKELMPRESLVLHALRARMQGAGRTQGRGFGILGGPASERHVTIIMYVCLNDRKKIRAQETEITLYMSDSTGLAQRHEGSG
ncbi:MAG: hypothetical protein ACREOF_07750 [Gemmatimonadales bacterium]